MIPALDFRIFGNGCGFAAPYFDQPFYWLSGEFYTFMHGFGAQLHSVQWSHPRAGERRNICGVEFRPLHSNRRWGRVMVAWATKLPSDIDNANQWLRQFECHLQSPNDKFEFRPALATATETAKTPKAVECEASQSGPKGNAQPLSPNSFEEQ